MQKCIFATDKVEYLGHIITAKGVATDPKKIEVITNWPKPENITQLRSLLGMTN